MRAVALVLVLGAALSKSYGQEKPRVFVTDSNSWQIVSSAGGSGGNWGASSAGGARPQTAEIIKTFGQRCPEVVVNNRADISNYVVELDHEGGKGLLRHKDKIAVFERVSGDSIFSESTLSVGGSVQDACLAITKHWASHAGEMTAASAKAAPTLRETPAPQTSPTDPATKASFALSSNPTGAEIEIDGSFVGDTPSAIQIEPGEHDIVIKKKGFEAWHRKIKVSGGTVTLNADLDAIVAGSPQ